MNGRKRWVDKVTKEEYEMNLDDNLTDLVARMNARPTSPAG